MLFIIIVVVVIDVVVVAVVIVVVIIIIIVVVVVVVVQEEGSYFYMGVPIALLRPTFLSSHGPIYFTLPLSTDVGAHCMCRNASHG